MSANVRHKWAKPDRAPIIAAVSVALVGLAVLVLLIYGIAVTA